MTKPYSLIHKLNIGLHSNNAVIKSSDYQSVVEADSIIRNAKTEALNILADAEKKVEVAVQKGFERGLQEAKEENESTLLAAKLKANAIITDSESEMIQLVQSSLEKILGDIDQKEAIGKLINQGVKVLRDEKRIVIHVAPEMESDLEDKLKNQLSNIADLTALEYFEIKTNHDLAPDAYVIESENTIVKGSLSEQLERLKRIVNQVIGD